MSLAMILGIDSSHFSYEESLAMQHAERRWVEVGKPANRRRLAGLLCSVIDDCDSSGLQFPPIFLERLRAMRCSSWEGPGFWEHGQMRYEVGDYIKVEFPDETTGVSEWMWVCVTGCDDAKRLVFGTLDNSPINDKSGKLKLGTELVISFSQVREHKKQAEFRAGSLNSSES